MGSKNNNLRLSDKGFTALKKPLFDLRLHKGVADQIRLCVDGILNKPQDNFDHGNNAPTVMLVPGFFCNSGAVSYLGGIMNEKYNVCYAPDFLMGNTGDINVSGQLLSNKAVRILKDFEKNGDLYLIGHSMGGLIAIESLQNGSFKINKLITAATPYSGTPIAKGMQFIKGIRQIQDFRNGIYNKFSNIGPYFDELQQHVSEDDNLVPAESQTTEKIFLPLSVKAKTRITAHPFTHTDFMTSAGAKDFTDSIQ